MRMVVGGMMRLMVISLLAEKRSTEVREQGQSKADRWEMNRTAGVGTNVTECSLVPAGSGMVFVMALQIQ
jgi:hypothetical protein